MCTSKNVRLLINVGAYHFPLGMEAEGKQRIYCTSSYLLRVLQSVAVCCSVLQCVAVCIEGMHEASDYQRGIQILPITCEGVIFVGVYFRFTQHCGRAHVYLYYFVCMCVCAYVTCPYTRG